MPNFISTKLKYSFRFTVIVKIIYIFIYLFIGINGSCDLQYNLLKRVLI